MKLSLLLKRFTTPVSTEECQITLLIRVLEVPTGLCIPRTVCIPGPRLQGVVRRNLDFHRSVQSGSRRGRLPTRYNCCISLLCKVIRRGNVFLFCIRKLIYDNLRGIHPSLLPLLSPVGTLEHLNQYLPVDESNCPMKAKNSGLM